MPSSLVVSLSKAILEPSKRGKERILSRVSFLHNIITKDNVTSSSTQIIITYAGLKLVKYKFLQVVNCIRCFPRYQRCKG